jgi:chemotaxis protein CheX
MKMQLIQPFISAADAILAEALNGPTSVADLSMDEDGYRRKGVAALIVIRGDIEGRVILDMDAKTAMRVASTLAGGEVEESSQVVRETVCELANMVIGNAVTLLNDHGYKFKVHPPEIHEDENGLRGSADTEAIAIYIETPAGRVFLNIAMRHNSRRQTDREFAPAGSLQ